MSSILSAPNCGRIVRRRDCLGSSDRTERGRHTMVVCFWMWIHPCKEDIWRASMFAKIISERRTPNTTLGDKGMVKGIGLFFWRCVDPFNHLPSYASTGLLWPYLTWPLRFCDNAHKNWPVVPCLGTFFNPGGTWWRRYGARENATSRLRSQVYIV